MYRLLEVGEVIENGDEIGMNGSNWEPAGLSEGSKIGSNMSDCKLYFFRRPVRVQSPGWRYLDAGETVQAGDETEYSVPPYWRCASGCSSYLGRVFEGHDKYFRRKLPANQGG